MLTGFVDPNYDANRDNRKSNTCYVFTLCRSCISWKYQLQSIVALSTTESEYTTITNAIKEASWLKDILFEIGYFMVVLQCSLMVSLVFKFVKILFSMIERNILM